MGILLDPKSSPSHPTEEILEEYVFDRLPEALTAQVEEHLLICPICQDAVTETDRFVSALKVAVRIPDLSHDPSPPIQSPPIQPARWGWGLVPVLALALLAIIAVRKQASEPVAPVAVSLSSLRGRDSLSSAPAGKPLLLGIETPDLAPGKPYRLEVVDASGSPVWTGAVTETDGKLVATLPKPLGTGVYWVRLYGADSELLREFGLSAK